MNFKRLFQPITLNQMTLKNRLVMTAMHLLYTEDGSVNQRTKDFYLARARGGVGMIIAGGAAADPYIPHAADGSGPLYPRLEGFGRRGPRL